MERTYQRSPELQEIFSKNHDHPDFYVYHYFYVTNNKRSDGVKEAVEHFNESNSNKQRYAQVFYLDDIEEAFYGEPTIPERHIDIELDTVNRGTCLAIRNEDYGLNLPLDAKYFLLPAITLYKALVYAEEKDYPIFDANIREYLGTTKAVNKRIISTLEDPDERKNFFFYNNGITIICASAEEKTAIEHRVIKLKDPQIVNGCQTVSSIKRVLSTCPDSRIDKEFGDVYVMAKILEIPDESEEQQELRKKIVKYNNSQNSIDEKTFEANNEIFQRLQTELKRHGFLLLLKQSDKQKYSEEYKKATELRERAQDYINRFGLSEKLIKPRDFHIPLEKLLQVILAFSGDAQQAFQKKGQLLKRDSRQYNLVTEKIRSSELTTRRLLNLYLLYLASEKAKASNQNNGKVPITWYLIEGFSRIECNGGDYALIDNYLDNPEAIANIIALYTGATSLYLDQYEKNNPGNGYNGMIKEELDMDLLKSFRGSVEQMATLKNF